MFIVKIDLALKPPQEWHVDMQQNFQAVKFL